MTFYMSICVAFCCQFLSIPLFAQQQKVDTTHTYFIPEVTVSDIYQTREVRSTAPLQLFSKEALKNLHALQVSDAVKHFAGVTVKTRVRDKDCVKNRVKRAKIVRFTLC